MPLSLRFWGEGNRLEIGLVALSNNRYLILFDVIWLKIGFQIQRVILHLESGLFLEI